MTTRFRGGQGASRRTTTSRSAAVPTRSASPAGLRPNGQNQFSLQIGGNWNPTTGDVGNPTPLGLSPKIYFFGVTRINASGGAITGFDTRGDAIPDTTSPAGNNALDITPYADNTPLGWGIETYWNQANRNAGGGVPNPDLLVFNGVLGVSENIVIQPSTYEAGQVFDNNAATNTPIAVVNYVLNSNIIVNGSSPSGTAGDTDNLFINGTDPANPGSSGNEDFLADFTASGDATHPMVRVYDAGQTPPTTRPTAAELGDTTGALANVLYNLQDFTNFNTINVHALAGTDFFDLLAGRANGALTINYDGEQPAASGSQSVSNTVQVVGAAGSNLYQIYPGVPLIRAWSRSLPMAPPGRRP